MTVSIVVTCATSFSRTWASRLRVRYTPLRLTRRTRPRHYAHRLLRRPTTPGFTRRRLRIRRRSRLRLRTRPGMLLSRVLTQALRTTTGLVQQAPGPRRRAAIDVTRARLGYVSQPSGLQELIIRSVIIRSRRARPAGSAMCPVSTLSAHPSPCTGRASRLPRISVIAHSTWLSSPVAIHPSVPRTTPARHRNQHILTRPCRTGLRVLDGHPSPLLVIARLPAS